MRRGSARQGNAELVGEVEQPAHHRAVERAALMMRRCGRSPRAVEPRDDVADIVDGAQHRHAADVAADARGAVGDEPDHAIEPRRVARRSRG